MFENVNVGDRVRLTHENGDVAEITAVYTGDEYIGSKYNTFLSNEGWTVDILAPTEPTANGTIVTLFDVAVERERTIVRTGVKWTDINEAPAQYGWDTWMNDAKPGSVKVVYTHE